MSVIKKADIEIKDLDCFRLALAQLGFELSGNGKPRYFSGLGPECDFIVKLPGKYDIGLRKLSNGAYETIADNELWGGKYISDNYGKNDAGRKILGESGSNLFKKYQMEVIKKQAKKKGASVKFEEQENGGIKTIWIGK